MKIQDFSTPSGESLKGSKCRTDPSVPGGAAEISEEEWNKATPAEPFPRNSDVTDSLISGPHPTPSGIRHDGRPFDYKGRIFEKSGDLWGEYRPVLLSPGETFVALQSWNGKTPPWDSGEGDFYVDVYNMSTGAKVAVVKGHRSQWTPDTALRGFWINRNTFVLPSVLEPSFLLCQFDVKSSQQPAP